jgi:hypothetical protein
VKTWATLRHHTAHRMLIVIPEEGQTVRRLTIVLNCRTSLQRSSQVSGSANVA